MVSVYVYLPATKTSKLISVVAEMDQAAALVRILNRGADYGSAYWYWC